LSDAPSWQLLERKQVLRASKLHQAARIIDQADALFIAAGAGMGVDSGLPDFRGDQGFWHAYPPFQKLGLNFIDLADPSWFSRDPELAWGFYGHRLHLYRDTVPHTGFERLRSWGQAKEAGYFVFTSNVDGQFQVAGFDDDRVVECHGSIHHLQCLDAQCLDAQCLDAQCLDAQCLDARARPNGSTSGDAIWTADAVEVDVDLETFRARPPLPHCPKCNTLARPNILMFGDSGFLGARTHAQQARMSRWVSDVGDKKLAIIECGAGNAVPTVRWQCERLSSALDATLIRINPREAQGPDGIISLAMGAEEALGKIDELL
jgi:NAD-dependent SIR2 family protein deacetylase